LRNIEGPQAAEAVRPLVSREGSVTASRNSVVVADFADNVARIRQIIASIDRESAATRTLALQNAGAREIAAALAALVAEGGARKVSVVPVDSANAIALRGDAATVAQLVEIARDLDERAASGTEIRVIFLEHADAEQLLPVLQQLLGQSTTITQTGDTTRASTRNSGSVEPQTATTTVAGAAGNGGGAFGGQSSVVTRFEGANAIVIAAPNDVQRMLGEVIRQLDTRREQVLVEAIIVEISDSAAKRLGVQLLLAGLEGSNIPFAVTNYSNASPSILSVAGGALASDIRERDPDSTLPDALEEAAANAIGSVSGGVGGFLARSGNAIFGAIINAVKSDTQSNILSTPSIMTLDNQEARILVGQEVPITTGEALSDNFDNAFRTVQRQNVGISLEVKPQINAGGAIKLDLRQEVSSIAGPVSEDVSELVLNKREIETTITVDDGEIVGIGGLLDDNERRTIEKIPFLGDLPVLGNLFKSKSRSRAKTNLMVFIRPTILRSKEDARAVAERRYGYIRGELASQDPEVEPTIDALVREYMYALPPAPPPPPPAPGDYAQPSSPAGADR
jgi:general secretion pathway protein D